MMASVGLTVALFVAGEAFPNKRVQGEAKFGALLSGMMGIVCVVVGKLPCFRHKKHRKTDTSSPEAATSTGEKRPLPKAVAGTQTWNLDGEDLVWALPDNPAFYRHAVRAGENALAEPHAKFELPSLFEIDPTAALRARGNWRLAFSSSKKILPEVERQKSQQKSVINYLSKEATQKKLSGILSEGNLKQAWAPAASAANTQEDTKPMSA